ncbi:hypothetical protein HYH03_015924 [Edaphochlamys debaryana]|uniref:Pherophorin domain-containing protein n=1 Tax=Edaphochlamys debaryana TaxID=47281 RepID=A0A835XJP2_9CHLO|nr:hypothetical protein HYH03_015924 [Edaphochlamys debaryana]|eukprot:KAG2485343.1 hypothetical protein HYH03_015924 [Edaphochlamys debaryana]
MRRWLLPRLLLLALLLLAGPAGRLCARHDPADPKPKRAPSQSPGQPGPDNAGGEAEEDYAASAGSGVTLDFDRLSFREAQHRIHAAHRDAESRQQQQHPAAQPHGTEHGMPAFPVPPSPELLEDGTLEGDLAAPWLERVPISGAIPDVMRPQAGPLLPDASTTGAAPRSNQEQLPTAAAADTARDSTVGPGPGASVPAVGHAVASSPPHPRGAIGATASRSQQPVQIAPQRAVQQRRRLGENQANMNWCIWGIETGECPPCNLRGLGEDPCLTDDDDSMDDEKCILSDFYDGNVYVEDLCGDEIRPLNVAVQDLELRGPDGVTHPVGRVFMMMEISGWLTLTLRLYCPWFALVDAARPAASLLLEITTPNGTRWERLWNSTDTGRPFITCRSLRVQAKALNPDLPGDNGCDAITYTGRVVFLTETYQTETYQNIDDADATTAQCTVANNGTANSTFDYSFTFTPRPFMPPPPPPLPPPRPPVPPAPLTPWAPESPETPPDPPPGPPDFPSPPSPEPPSPSPPKPPSPHPSPPSPPSPPRGPPSPPAPPPPLPPSPRPPHPPSPPPPPPRPPSPPPSPPQPPSPFPPSPVPPSPAPPLFPLPPSPAPPAPPSPYPPSPAPPIPPSPEPPSPEPPSPAPSYPPLPPSPSPPLPSPPSPSPPLPPSLPAFPSASAALAPTAAVAAAAQPASALAPAALPTATPAAVASPAALAASALAPASPVPSPPSLASSPIAPAAVAAPASISAPPSVARAPITKATPPAQPAPAQPALPAAPLAAAALAPTAAAALPAQPQAALALPSALAPSTSSPFPTRPSLSATPAVTPALPPPTAPPQPAPPPTAHPPGPPSRTPHAPTRAPLPALSAAGAADPASTCAVHAPPALPSPPPAPAPAAAPSLPGKSGPLPSASAPAASAAATLPTHGTPAPAPPAAPARPAPAAGSPWAAILPPTPSPHTPPSPPLPPWPPGTPLEPAPAPPGPPGPGCLSISAPSPATAEMYGGDLLPYGSVTITAYDARTVELRVALDASHFFYGAGGVGLGNAAAAAVLQGNGGDVPPPDTCPTLGAIAEMGGGLQDINCTANDARLLIDISRELPCLAGSQPVEAHMLVWLVALAAEKPCDNATAPSLPLWGGTNDTLLAGGAGDVRYMCGYMQVGG